MPQSTTTMIGEARPEIEDWEAVALTFERPDGAEAIAYIRASSGDQGSVRGANRHAITKLKKAAAAVGANVVVIGDAWNDPTDQAIPVGSSYMMIEVDVEVFTGTAVYVENCEICYFQRFYEQYEE